jgi:hypothetical protein
MINPALINVSVLPWKDLKAILMEPDLVLILLTSFSTVSRLAEMAAAWDRTWQRLENKYGGEKVCDN